MRYLSAGLIYVAVATVTALLLGIDGGGLRYGIALISLVAGAAAGIAAYFYTPATTVVKAPAEPVVERYRGIWLWVVGGIFAMFALRSFCWLVYYDGNDIRIQSPNNLGDLGLHITYIKTFANGVALWPDSPLYVASKLRYPAGIDLFNAIFTCLGFDLRHQLAITGLLASVATFYALYRWGDTFGVAGFLFNGGLIGYQIFRTFRFLDFQGGPTISWKSIALSMFVTQRGLLYAIPAGLLLLWQWRAKYGDDPELEKQRLPTWVEYILYATMPLFHVHTFLALNVVVVLLFIARPVSRRPLLQLAGAAVIPASFFVWLITDHFHAGSVFEWHPGWTQRDGDFAMPFFRFWFINFGFFLPVAIGLLGVVAHDQWKAFGAGERRVSNNAIFLSAAAVIFMAACLVKTAPWEWDNTKILIWAYFITLPVMWDRLLRHCTGVVRAAACCILFLSGFVSLIGGLAAGRPGFTFASRAEVDAVAVATHKLPVEARFAAFPTYNHPLLLNGRKVVCGYAGHLWTQGIDYEAIEKKLNSLMLGQGDWMQTARDLRVRYLYWGDEEKANYGGSTRPWENKLPLVAKGNWGAIYDLGR
ncbi:MAG: hypothetical protein DLM52_05895 [Chthoniobacterales bacterium]|nr:MAG: hypothetical protein DLM52_05895 [Chthoniobacterales bacterium]